MNRTAPCDNVCISVKLLSGSSTSNIYPRQWDSPVTGLLYMVTSTSTKIINIFYTLTERLGDFDVNHPTSQEILIYLLYWNQYWYWYQIPWTAVLLLDCPTIQDKCYWLWIRDSNLTEIQTLLHRSWIFFEHGHNILDMAHH